MRLSIILKNSGILLPFIFLFASSVIYAQRQIVDSLRNTIGATNGNDTSKVLLYYELGKQFENANPDTALWY